MLPLRRTSVLAAFLVATLPPVTRAQASASVHPTPPVVANAARRSGPIVIDGIPDEAAWRAARIVSGFRQQQPDDGEAPSFPTEVRILYDDDALYISARMTDPAAAHGGIRSPLARRDQLLDGNGNNGAFNSLTTDKFIVMLDPYHNHLDGVLFEISPSGVRGDSYNGDGGWDPVWQAAAHVDSAGWTAEMRIPFSQLRFRSGTEQEWGLQMWRYLDRLNEQDMWAYRKLNEAHGPSFFGHLAGMRLPPQPRAAEVVPYVVTKGLFQPAAAGDPFHSSSDAKFNAGADVKYLITPNLTLNATLNPDFGQVEVDPATLNLSAYETFYEEKRPFFVTDQSPFYFGGSSCMFCSNFSGLDVFYTRRIGRPPQLAGLVGNAAYASVPDNAAILGAAKITGRTASGYTVGLLDAVTNRETARYVAAPGQPFQEQVVEPLTNYFVGRVSKELRQGATTVGGILTSTIRSMGDDSLVSNRLRSRATALGLDWDHGWHNRDYRWNGSVVFSDVEGSASAIGLTQRSVTHYYQRPDRAVTPDGLFRTRYDPTATAMRGYGLYTRLARQNGDWLWEVMEDIRSPGFEVNDLAYLGDADYLYTNANLGRQWSRPTRWYRNMFLMAGGQVRHTFGGIRDDQQEHFFYQWTLPNYWRLRVFGIHRPSLDDTRLTRGGPVVMRNGYRFGHAQVSTDARKPAVFDLSLEASSGTDDPTAGLTISPGVAIKPASNVFIQLSPTWRTLTGSAQYVTAVTDPTATAFFGKRYVFAWLDSRTLSLDTRVNWTFTPDLTLQVYAQPYISAAAFSRFREFAAPRSLVKRDYGKDVGTITFAARTNSYTVDPDGAGPAAPFTFGNPSQTYRALRGTAVLRWEYRPGSTIFLAWTQQRAGASASGDFDLSRDRSAMLADPANNVFVVKMNWWVGR